MWLATDFDEAIELAEAEDYAGDLDAEYLGLAQAYALADDLAAGAEVFSLMRTSSLEPSDYLKVHFETGTERQMKAGPGDHA